MALVVLLLFVALKYQMDVRHVWINYKWLLLVKCVEEALPLSALTCVTGPPIYEDIGGPGKETWAHEDVQKCMPWISPYKWKGCVFRRSELFVQIFSCLSCGCPSVIHQGLNSWAVDTLRNYPIIPAEDKPILSLDFQKSNTCLHWDKTTVISCHGGPKSGVSSPGLRINTCFANDLVCELIVALSLVEP